MRNLWEGSEGITWLASTKSEELKSGEFYLDRQVQPKHLSGWVFNREGNECSRNSEEEVSKFMDKLREVVGV